MERVRGIEPPTSAWEADVLPLNYTRMEETLHIFGAEDGIRTRGPRLGKAMLYP
jgi:hypothetical protein